MRAAAILAATVVAAFAATSLAAPADAAGRKKRDYPVVTVKPRSYLNAGTDVPVGSMSRYVYDTSLPRQSLQQYPGQIGGDKPLPAPGSTGGIPVDFRAPAFLMR